MIDGGPGQVTVADVTYAIRQTEGICPLRLPAPHRPYPGFAITSQITLLPL